MKYYLTFTILLFSFLALNGQSVSREDVIHSPANLEEAVFHLMKIMPDSSQQNILLMSEDDFIAGSHFRLGMWIRNNWRLWRGGQLANDFKSRGIFHPDDMSGIILTSFFRELHGLDWELDEQIKRIQNYWKEAEEYQYRLENDTAFARQEKIIFENSIRQENEELKLEFPIGTYMKVRIDYSECGLHTYIIGEIIDWRVGGVKIIGNLGVTEKGSEIEAEYLEAKIRIVEFMDMEKKERVEGHYTRANNDELWVNVSEINFEYRIKND